MRKVLLFLALVTAVTATVGAVVVAQRTTPDPARPPSTTETASPSASPSASEPMILAESAAAATAASDLTTSDPAVFDAQVLAAMQTTSVDYLSAKARATSAITEAKAFIDEIESHAWYQELHLKAAQ